MKKSLACLVLLMAAASKGFQLQGPLDLISAQLGGPVLLPCSVETPLPLEELEVEWRRTDSDVLVHLFQEGEERPESQDYAYRGRAHFFSGELVRGNYSVELNNVTREDAGVYICKVYTNLDHSSVTAEVHFEHFLVTGAGVVSGYAGEEVVLHCSVDSHISPEKMEEVTWKRTDNKMLVLLYQDGEVISDSSDVQYRGRAELFPTEIPKGNFSLRLKDVRTEDRGEYICEAYSGDLSANTTVFLQELGFSNLHWSILVLCSISLLCTLVLIVPAWMSLQKKDTSQRSLVIHLSLILCPNILLGIGFILWGIVEGFLGEAAGCSTVNIIRFLLLIKTAPYLDILPGSFQKLKTLSVPAEYSIVTVVVYSVYFRNQQIMFESTEAKRVMGFTFGLILFCVFAVIPGKIT
ncbi:hypothetical protein AALO_G00187770 [Alosa alosa]|uniref:Ig-like domain-containing protein n=1 Tax=Alosa alosa TaxID=278164 RepID=A0AAV6G4H7_9TELE|nr:hypothetical protein AALO_G00187770 [Alosa alosa]